MAARPSRLAELLQPARAGQDLQHRWCRAIAIVGSAPRRRRAGIAQLAAGRVRRGDVRQVFVDDCTPGASYLHHQAALAGGGAALQPGAIDELSGHGA